MPEFNATCTYSHSRPDDPIVFPGLPGASHMHSFFGNRSTNANTTTDTLLANTGTSCGPAQDLSAYWIPTLYERGLAIEPKGVVVYYGSRLADPTKTVPFPQGFRMIAGDAKLQVPTPAGSVNQFYCAGPGGEIGRSADGNWPVCAPAADADVPAGLPGLLGRRAPGQPRPQVARRLHLRRQVRAARSRSRSRRSRSSSPTRPAAAPTASRWRRAWPRRCTATSFIAWDNAALGHRVKNCIVQKAKCNTAGNF